MDGVLLSYIITETLLLPPSKEMSPLIAIIHHSHTHSLEITRTFVSQELSRLLQKCYIVFKQNISSEVALPE